ncbi:hypothetical protein [Rhodopirellula bahusiensis]|uniref:hypothetical protein n=1 Tax=Rhodopirellula bahusiensis TaxID=2014065 RepID=UPI003262FDAA
MTQRLAYLDDTFLLSHESVIADSGGDEHGDYIIVEDCIFYPQGGGQPWDTGELSVQGKVHSVDAVRFAEGSARIYSRGATDLAVGSSLTQLVDRKRRLVNSTSHTMGHLVANVVETLYPNYVARKGYHFPEGSYVEFSGEMPESNAKFLDKLNEKIAESLSQNLRISTKQVSLSELQQICSNVPTGLPVDKPLRVVQIGNYDAIPCGGTHLNSLSADIEVAVTKIKRKKPNIRVSYQEK